MVERRDPDEVRTIGGRIDRARPAWPVENRAFDVTPAALVTGYITERGILERRPTWSSVEHDVAERSGAARR